MFPNGNSSNKAAVEPAVKDSLRNESYPTPSDRSTTTTTSIAHKGRDVSSTPATIHRNVRQVNDFGPSTIRNDGNNTHALTRNRCEGGNVRVPTEYYTGSNEVA